MDVRQLARKFVFLFYLDNFTARLSSFSISFKLEAAKLKMKIILRFKIYGQFRLDVRRGKHAKSIFVNFQIFMVSGS